MKSLKAIASSLALLAALAANAEENPHGAWMMDTEQDTGLEPDPATASQDMWKSKAIWVRNKDDGGGDHQNPEYGQENFVHARLLREVTEREEPIAGEVEFYVANASTGLSWQSQWTLVGSVPVLSFPPTASELIVKAPWKPEGTGHYCMVARWVSPEDMPHADNPDIDRYTRDNNNVVWRNLNVIDLAANEKSLATLIVRNVDEGNKGVHLAFRLPRKEGALPFVGKQGRVFIRLHEKLFHRWQEMGAKSEGLELVEETLLEVVDPQNAVLFGIPMELGEEFPVEIEFQRFESVEPGVFHFDAVQLQEEGKETGGVGYEIHTTEKQQLPEKK